MANLKNQQKKLLTREITGKIMEYFMGLNEKNEVVLRRMSEKTSKKLVKAYTEAIKSQHKEILKASEKNGTSIAPVVYTEQTNLMAS